jgi:uncharacterized Zn finger protein (UPF0148 family)
MSARCPYCGGTLGRAPKREAQCPICGRTIYHKQGRPLTKDEKDREAWLRDLRIDEAEYERSRKSLASEYGFEPPWHDTVWRMLTRRAADSNDPSDLAEIYRLQSIFLGSQGKDASSAEREEAKWRLQFIKRQGMPRVTLRTSNDEAVCSACGAFEGSTMSVDEALERLPFPTACTAPNGCRCQYVGTS